MPRQSGQEKVAGEAEAAEARINSFGGQPLLRRLDDRGAADLAAEGDVAPRGRGLPEGVRYCWLLPAQPAVRIATAGAAATLVAGGRHLRARHRRLDQLPGWVNGFPARPPRSAAAITAPASASAPPTPTRAPATPPRRRSSSTPDVHAYDAHDVISRRKSKVQFSAHPPGRKVATSRYRLPLRPERRTPSPSRRSGHHGGARPKLTRIAMSELGRPF